MDECESHVLALRELQNRIEMSPEHAGWYMYQAYRLGKGDSINDVMTHPIKTKVRHLYLVETSKYSLDERARNILERTDQ